MTAKSLTLKLKCGYVAKLEHGSLVKLYPDHDDPRNKAWAPFTPAAYLELTVRNEYAEALLTPGRNFLVTLTPQDDLPETQTKPQTQEQHP